MKETFRNTISICPECRDKIPAKVVFNDNKVFMEKNCPTHGNYNTLISSDQDSYRESFSFKKDEQGNSHHDCDQCSDPHIALVEVTNQCNLNCPICIAGSNSKKPYYVSLDQFDSMLDRLIESNSTKEIHFQGGEPTLHPEFFKLIELAQEKGIVTTRISTNGVIISKDKKFVEKLQDFNVVVHLQFDGFDDQIYKKLRGKQLYETKLKAIENLNKYDIPTILAPTIVKDANDHEAMKIINLGLDYENIVGITFHLVAYAGHNKHDPPTDRMTMPDMIKRIVEDSGNLISKEDVVRNTWHNSECFSSIYLVKHGDDVKTADRNFNVRSLNPALKNYSRLLYSKNFIKDHNIVNNIKGRNVLQIIIKPLMDAYNFDLERARNCVVGVLTPEGNLVPYCAFNNLYRNKIIVDNIAKKKIRK